MGYTRGIGNLMKKRNALQLQQKQQQQQQEPKQATITYLRK